MSRTYFKNLRADFYGAVKNRWERLERSDEIRGFTPERMPDTEDIWKENDETAVDDAEDTDADTNTPLGFVYTAGSQSLSVAVPGDTAAVRFSSHTVLNGLRLCGEEVIAKKPGVYEIGYCVNIKASCAVQAVFALQANGRMIEGSAAERLLGTEKSTVNASLLTELNKDDAVRLVMMSGTAVKAELSGGGVTASMTIKKLG